MKNNLLTAILFAMASGSAYAGIADLSKGTGGDLASAVTSKTKEAAASKANKEIAAKVNKRLLAEGRNNDLCCQS